ncbi:MAG TPA: hypothetical protein DEA26_02740 [Oceanospirillales bacterium]|nr:hypothetical protein [Oceanospirillales bacterium]|tara:strand:- start:4451 stop:5407 length:957 start_codon:yes stop_codon:yes gene_type:complete
MRVRFSYSRRPVYLRCLSLVFLALLTGLSGCSEEPTELTHIAPDGISLLVEADLPYGTDSASVAAAVYDDGEPTPMTGGDLLRAQSDSETVFLSNDELSDNFYAAALNVPNPDAEGSILVDIIHDAQASRSDRWYPTDKALVDPGPGSAVGYSALLTLPEAPQIITPQSGLSYSQRSDEFTLEWLGAPADSLTLVSRVSCASTEGDSLGWVRSQDIDDDQSLTLSIADLIPQDGIIETTGTLSNLVTGFLQVLIDVALISVTLGLYEPDSVDLSDFTLDSCDIGISLVRKLNGELDEGVSDGSAVGSRSDSLTLEYRP